MNPIAVSADQPGALPPPVSSKRRGPRMGLVIIGALLLLLHGYVGLRLISAMALSDGGRFVAVLVLICSCVLGPAGLFARRFLDQSVGDRVTWIGTIWLGWFSSLLILTMARDAGLAIAWLTASATWLPALESYSAIAVPIIATIASLVGFIGARRVARVVDVEVPIADLPFALHGFTIVQISDIHVGPTIKRPYVEAIVDAVNRLGPDVIAVTGDLVDGTVQELAWDVAPLARLSARNGSFFVTGNHEYYSGAGAWTDELRRLGLRILHNEHVTIDHHGALLVLAGVPDISAHHFNDLHRSDPHKAMAGAPSAAAIRILLAHQPRSAPAAARAGFDLQLSGHTHGGQFWPWNLFVRLQQPFTAGLHRLEQLWVYTSRGTGYWGPPTRFGVPSEITRLRLVPHWQIQLA